jgi:hypothetical protein
VELTARLIQSAGKPPMLRSGWPRVEAYDLAFALLGIADRAHGQLPFLAKSAVLFASGMKNAGTYSFFPHSR